MKHCTVLPVHHGSRRHNAVRAATIIAIVLMAGLAPALAQDVQSGDRKLVAVRGGAEQPQTQGPEQALPKTDAQSPLKTFEYAIKFVCGKPEAPVVAPGEYFTAINVHNPSYRPVAFRKKIAVALPGEKAGPISPFFEAGLKPDEAFEIDCPDILRHAGRQQQVFLKGFVVIETPSELDVVAVYTAGHPQVETLEIKRVEPRPVQPAITAPPNPRDTCGNPASGVGCCCNEPKPGGGMFPDCKAPLMCVRDPNATWNVCATHQSLNTFLDPTPAVAAGQPAYCGQPH